MDEPNLQQTPILIVDHNVQSVDSIRSGLALTTIEMVDTDSTAEAKVILEELRPRLILTELSLLDASGFSLCRWVRDHALLATTPILTLSRWSSEEDRILAFECGADDFLAKPFFARELVARIEAILRRSTATRINPSEVDTAAPYDVIQLDPSVNEITIEGHRIILTPLEYSLLSALIRKSGHVLSRNELLDGVWGDGSPLPGARTIDTHIKSLRRKMGPARETVETVRGLGYRFSERALPRLTLMTSRTPSG